jgi:delta24(24(1))-sterol reductase
MVIFWNFAGVPFVRVIQTCLPIVLTNCPLQSYVYSVVYMASHDPETYRFSTPTYILMFSTLLTAYYMYVSSSHYYYS